MRKISTKTKLNNGKTLIKYEDGGFEIISGDETEEELNARKDKEILDEMSSYEKEEDEDDDDEDKEDLMRSVRGY